MKRFYLISILVLLFGSCTPSGILPTTRIPDQVTATFSTAIQVPTQTPLPRFLILQEGNFHTRTSIHSKRASELEDNRIGHIYSNLWRIGNFEGLLNTEISNLGAKRIRLSVNEADVNQINWLRPELEIDPSHDQFITWLTEEGITITYRLQFWDKANHPDGKGLPSPRFKTEEEIQRYLDFVRFIVHHFKDRVNYYEIWNEPACEGLVQCIDVEDYINLVRRTVPIIRQEYPDAKITVGGIAGLDSPGIRDYLFTILESDIMPLANVITWHPMFSSSPELNPHYYYYYPAIVQQIKGIASAHGFKGEYMAEEIIYRSPDCTWCNENDPIYSNIKAAKYYARGIVMNLGMGVTAGVAGNSSLRRLSFNIIKNLGTLMAGAKTTRLPVRIHSEAEKVRNYGFYLPNGDLMVALFSDGIAVDRDPGTPGTVTLEGLTTKKVTGIDVLNNFEQELISYVDGGNLVIPDLLIKDYPIFLRISE